ncbi:FMN-binding protein [Clostridium tetanomorphum]|uniref:FMN-binding protein n=1 Tax=Clostridium tetanomorphum TaxID=1553 RepID=A0A923J1X2_CLOTT|nr:FMN-binding protein [Clostridium tetanomorphum]MBC2398155.1 FMN-binding protein [Clostridium tetanomorphum]NRZ98859.1 major membrane immunogen (membrane-anchored lipoprotein) [Clostridium tetanomorphum]
MKKVLSVVLTSILSLSLLAGCGSSNKDTNTSADKTKDTKTAAEYKDGKYKATYNKLDNHGWKAFVEVEIKDGKIASVDFDYLNKDNKRKSEDKEYNEKMKPISKTAPNEFCPKLEKDLVDKQEVDKVDAISGATTSTKNFKNLAKAALENAKKGDTKEAVVELKE